MREESSIIAERPGEPEGDAKIPKNIAVMGEMN